MDLIAEVIPNQWVTGIGAGIISSIVAYLIAQRYLSWGGNKEYLRKVDTANKDVIYALRSIISDEFKFNVTPEMLSSIISANSVKHGVDQKDMYSPDQFIDALVKEVMDSNFLSVNTKMSYCTSIISLKIPLTPELEELSTIAPSIKLSQQSQLIKLSSLLIASMAGLLTLLCTFLTLGRDFMPVSSELALIMVPTVVLMVLMLGLTAFQKAARELRKNQASDDLGEDRSGNKRPGQVF